MPTETVSKWKPFGQPGNQYQELFLTRTWNSSNRVNGRLYLRANPYNLDKRMVLSRRSPPGYENSFPNQAPDVYNHAPQLISRLAAANAETSYGKFRGKLYYGSATLGVTLAQWKQSANSLTRLYQAVHRTQADHMEELLRRSWRPKELSDKWLEYIFGYVPLYNDVKAIADEIIQHAIPPIWVRAQSTSYGTEPWYGDWGMKAIKHRHIRSGAVRIENPNLWLAERAGLINLGVVAWDIVPWSFAINMFVNINQLIQSLSDFVGLSFVDYSDTIYVQYDSFVQKLPYGSGRYRGIDMRRTPGPSPVSPRTLSFRLPELDFEKFITAASLATQRYGKLKTLTLKLAKGGL